MKDSMDVQTVFAIRDARGLSKYEKLFLYTVESRGVLYTSLRRTAEDMGVSESTVTKAIRTLKSKGLVIAKSKRGADGGARPTEYRVDRQALQMWTASVEDRSLVGEDLTSVENDRISPEAGVVSQEASPGSAMNTTSGYDTTSKETSKETSKSEP